MENYFGADDSALLIPQRIAAFADQGWTTYLLASNEETKTAINGAKWVITATTSGKKVCKHAPAITGARTTCSKRFGCLNQFGQKEAGSVTSSNNHS